MVNIFAKIIAVDWERALFAYDTRQAGFVSVELTAPDGSVQKYGSTEAIGTGRLELDKLKADCNYSGQFICNGGKTDFTFDTLPQPEGKMLGAFSVIADPHLSCGMENRKGRFFMESAMLLQDIVNQCNNLQNDFVLLPGDITNKGLVEEYSTAHRILSGLQMPCLAVAGNHDLDGGDAKKHLWQSWIGALEHILETEYGIFIGLDTSSGLLPESSIEILETALSRKKKLFIFTHYQLYDNPDINRGCLKKIVANAASCNSMLERLAVAPAIIYAGHQNIPSIVSCGNAHQINLPQPAQYPCGFTYVRCYANGYYHTFMPIGSEVLRQYSRHAGNQAVVFYNETQWDSSYREGKSLDQLNFLIKEKHRDQNSTGNQHYRIRTGNTKQELTTVS